MPKKVNSQNLPFASTPLYSVTASRYDAFALLFFANRENFRWLPVFDMRSQPAQADPGGE